MQKQTKWFDAATYDASATPTTTSPSTKKLDRQTKQQFCLDFQSQNSSAKPSEKKINRSVQVYPPSSIWPRLQMLVGNVTHDVEGMAKH